jgi:hypothetical protein
MSAHGRPPLCKPEHVSRARELCARGVINPELLEPASWARQQNDGRKGRKGRKPRILRKWALSDDGAKRRKPAETGGTPLQELCSRNRPQFCRLIQGVHSIALIGVSLAEIAVIPCKKLSRRQPHCASLFRGALQDLPAVHQRQSG